MKDKKKIKVSLELINDPKVAIKLSRLYDMLLAAQIEQQAQPQTEEGMPEEKDVALKVQA